MAGNPILPGFLLFGNRSRPNHPDLHTLWLHPGRLPKFVIDAPATLRILDLLGPLDWTHFPERDLQRNWGQVAVPYAAFAAFFRDSATISCVMSTPITVPCCPTARAARKQSNPPPLPRSRTVSPGFRAAMACGFPHPRPRLAPSGAPASSSGEYPRAGEQHDDDEVEQPHSDPS